MAMMDKQQITTLTAIDVTRRTTSLRALAASFKAALSISKSPAPEDQSDDLGDADAKTSDPLDVLRDSSSLLKAQITKLGLLLINKPLTPSAIHSILLDIESRILPTLFASAAHIFGRQRPIFGHSFANEVTELLRGLLSGFDTLLGVVDAVVLAGQQNGESVKGSGNATNAVPPRKEDVLATVGQVFAACDDIVNMVSVGVVSLLLKKVKAQVQLIEDAIAELTEWGEDVSEEPQPQPQLQEDRQQSRAGKHDSLDVMAAQLSLTDRGQGDDYDDEDYNDGRLPAYRQDLVELVPEATRRADLSVKLCLALSKRRIRKIKFQSAPLATQEQEAHQIKVIDCCEQVVSHIGGIQDDMDETAAAFYELDADMVKQRLRSLSRHAKAVSALVMLSWDGAEDDFTQWLQTWNRLLDKRNSMIGNSDT